MQVVNFVVEKVEDKMDKNNERTVLAMGKETLKIIETSVMDRYILILSTTGVLY